MQRKPHAGFGGRLRGKGQGSRSANPGPRRAAHPTRRAPHKGHAGAGTHVLIRAGTASRCAGPRDFLPDGSYLAEFSGGGITLTVRVIEYTVALAGRDSSSCSA